MSGLAISPTLAVLQRFAKPLLYLGIAAAVFWAGSRWVDKQRQEAADAREEEIVKVYTDRINEANARVAATNQALSNMGTAFGELADARAQSVHVTVDPIIRSIENETQSDPRYRECAVSDGVRGQVNSAAASVNAALDQSSPSKP